MNFQENIHKDTTFFSLFHTTGCMALASFIGSVAFDHLGKVVSAKILPVKFLLSLTHTHLKLYPINLVYSDHWRRQWQPTPVLLPGESHGRGSLVGCSPWGHWESDTTERLHFQFSLSCIGEGNGNPLRCSCLENPRDRGAWWAAIYGVAQSQTRLK